MTSLGWRLCGRRGPEVVTCTFFRPHVELQPAVVEALVYGVARQAEQLVFEAWDGWTWHIEEWGGQA